MLEEPTPVTDPDLRRKSLFSAALWTDGESCGRANGISIRLPEELPGRLEGLLDVGRLVPLLLLLLSLLLAVDC